MVTSLSLSGWKRNSNQRVHQINGQNLLRELGLVLLHILFAFVPPLPLVADATFSVVLRVVSFAVLLEHGVHFDLERTLAKREKELRIKRIVFCERGEETSKAASLSFQASILFQARSQIRKRNN